MVVIIVVGMRISKLDTKHQLVILLFRDDGDHHHVDGDDENSPVEQNTPNQLFVLVSK